MVELEPELEWRGALIPIDFEITSYLDGESIEIAGGGAVDTLSPPAFFVPEPAFALGIGCATLALFTASGAAVRSRR